MKGVSSFEISGRVTRHMNFFWYQKLWGKWNNITTCRSLMCTVTFIAGVCVCVCVCMGGDEDTVLTVLTSSKANYEQGGKVADVVG